MILLPFPSSLLAGHAKGNGQWAKIKATKEHREWARLATLEARGADRSRLEDGQAANQDDKSDIAINIRFYPPDNRGDRMNFPARMKPYIDGIADALGVNDRRFLPVFEFCAPEKPGRVEVRISLSSGVMHEISQRQPLLCDSAAVETKTARAVPRKPRSGHVHNAERERQA